MRHRDGDFDQLDRPAMPELGSLDNDDQAGTLNLITPNEIRQAAGLVRTGRVISLAFPVDAAGPQTEEFGSGRARPPHVAQGARPRGRRLASAAGGSAGPTTPSTCPCNAARSGCRILGASGSEVLAGVPVEEQVAGQGGVDHERGDGVVPVDAVVTGNCPDGDAELDEGQQSDQ